MKKNSDTLIAFKTILTISLSLIALFIAGFSISCQSQTPANSTQAPGTNSSQEPNPQVLSPVEVVIEGFAFRPATLRIPVGTTVTWRNNDSLTHTVTARDKSFDSSSLSTGATFVHTFEQKGTFEYYCIFHPSMIGNVIVE